MSDKKALYAKAQEAGHDLPEYDKITTKELEALLDGGDKSDEESAGTLTVINNRKNPVHVDGVQIAPMGSVTLTDGQMKNERLMAKLTHGVKTGVYKFK